MGMTVESRPNTPTVPSECVVCPFALRAIVAATIRYSHLSRTALINCQADGGGGLSQVEPGKFVAFHSRRIIISPISQPVAGERIWMTGDIPACPRSEIENLGEKYPHMPDLKPRHEDSLGRVY